MNSNYFDHAATSPVDPRVLNEMLPWLGLEVGNAHSIHSFGKRAHEAVEHARQRIALAINADDPYQITFVSGATEAATWLAAATDKPIFCSPFEHSCVLKAASGMGGFAIPNDGYILDFESLPEECTAFVMAVNNETGAILPKMKTGGICDATQAIGHLNFEVDKLEGAFFSGHKFGAAQGIGAVYLANPDDWPGLIIGGGQENGRRGGTTNVASIVGLGLACEIASQELSTRLDHVTNCHNEFIRGFCEVSDREISPKQDHSPHILSLTFPEVLAEILVIEMDLAGFGISSGSACSSQSTELSPTLLALGYTESEAKGTVRISFGTTNTLETSFNAGKKLATILQKVL